VQKHNPPFFEQIVTLQFLEGRASALPRTIPQLLSKDVNLPRNVRHEFQVANAHFRDAVLIADEVAGRIKRQNDMFAFQVEILHAGFGESPGLQNQEFGMIRLADVA
jgi:hypothetical protein